MSELKVETKVIEKIDVHPNAEKLEIATIMGWQCIVQKDKFKAGDTIVYIPIDSILPEELEKRIFGPDSKIVLHKHRVKTIKIRGMVSQGLVITYEMAGLDRMLPPEVDVTAKLGIKKYEPELPAFQTNMIKGRLASKKEVNPNFHKYTDIGNVKNFVKMFESDEEVVVTEKIHGTNFRAGYVPFVAVTLWEKVKEFFGFAPKFQFVFGSHNVQLQHKMIYDGFYAKNVYAKAVRDYQLDKILGEGEVVYGEIYGDGIQKNYKYGLSDGETKLVIFDIMKDGKYLDWVDFKDTITNLFIKGSGISAGKCCEHPPVLFQGKFKDLNIETIVSGDSVMVPEQKVREGAVIKPVVETKGYTGARKILKAISPEYLMKDNTDFH